MNTSYYCCNSKDANVKDTTTWLCLIPDWREEDDFGKGGGGGGRGRGGGRESKNKPETEVTGSWLSLALRPQTP